MKAGLVLVDLQEDFLGQEGLFPAAPALVRRVVALLEMFRSRGLPVVHVVMAVRPDLSDAMPHWRRRGRAYCEAGSPGAAPPPELTPSPGEPVVTKRAFSGFGGTGLGDCLAEAGVDTVVLAGVHGHSCVRATATDAYSAGWGVVAADEAVGSDDPVHAVLTRRYLDVRGVRYLSHEEVGHLLDGGSMPDGAETVRAGLEPAVARAVAAQAEWYAVPRAERARKLAALPQLFQEAREELAGRVTEAVGKPVRFSRLEVDRCAALIGACLARDGSVEERVDPMAPAGGDGGAVVAACPVGPVAVVTPWNHPVAIPVGKIVPALLFGNSVVWKPAPECNALTDYLVDLIRRGAGLPPGVLERVAGGWRTGEELMAARGIGAVTLTGGARAGHAARAICAQRQIPLQAELGGNNASIVWAGCDLAAAAAAVARGAFGFAGQRCTANRRAVVDSAVAEEFVGLVVAECRGLAWGAPEDESTVIGPVISEDSAGRLGAIVQRAKDDGIEVVRPLGEAPTAGAGRVAAGRYFPPTLVVGPPLDHEIVQTETFGPVLVVQVARSWEEALRMCNGVGEGLVAALFSGDADRRRQFLENAEAGVLKLDESTADVGVEAPFGGWKASGLGPPEHGPGNAQFFTKAQAVYGMGA